MDTASWYEGDVIANGLRMHFYRTGCPAMPPIVLAHGSSDNGRCWISVAQALQDDYDVIMPDARGHGLSEAPERDYDSETMAADLAGFIQALGLGQPYVMGHSMGAATAATLAATYPELVSAAILSDPPWWIQDPPMPTQEARDEQVQRVREMRAMSTEALMDLARTQSPNWPEIELGPWAESKQQHSPYHVSAPRKPRTSYRELVPRIQCPILLITADAERGSLVTPDVAVEAASLWKQVHVAHIAGAGHNIRREQFGPYMEALRGFLNEMDARN